MLYRINKKYRIGKKLGSGAFGEIYEGTDIYTNETVAIKVERLGAEHPQLRHEYKVYRLLNGCDGVPMARYYGTEGPYNVLVMDILGKSLEALFEECGRKFTLPTVLMIAEQLISRIETIHKKSLIHRDIKPDNFLIGRGTQSRTVFAVDFGLSKLYMDPKSNRHISYKEGKNLIGTVRYASLYTHMGIEQSRRDDLESIGYVLMYFLRGSLPWQGLQAATKAQKYERVFLKKKSTTIETLCLGFPAEFSKYFRYVKSLKFCDTPNYEYLRALFQGLLRTMKPPSGSSRFFYDWEMLPQRSAAQPKTTTGVPATAGTGIAAHAGAGAAPAAVHRGLDPPAAVAHASDPRWVAQQQQLQAGGGRAADWGPRQRDQDDGLDEFGFAQQQQHRDSSSKKRRASMETDYIEAPGHADGYQQAGEPPKQRVKREAVRKEGVNGLNFDPTQITNPTPRQVKNACSWNTWIDDHICHPIRSNPDPKYHRASQVQRACVICRMFTSYYCTKCPPSSIALSFVCMKPKCYMEHVLTYRRWNSIWVPENKIVRVEDDSVQVEAGPNGCLKHPLLDADPEALMAVPLGRVGLHQFQQQSQQALPPPPPSHHQQEHHLDGYESKWRPEPSPDQPYDDKRWGPQFD